MVTPNGLSNDKLHRRQSDNGGVEARSFDDGEINHDPIGETRLHNQLQEINSGSSPINGILGLFDRLNEDVSAHTRAKNGRDSNPSKESVGSRNDDGQGASEAHWHSFLHETSNTTGPIILQSTPSSEECCLVNKRGPGHSAIPRLRPEGGATLVDRTSDSLEQVFTKTTETPSEDTDRCIQNRLGSSLSGKEDGGTVVSRGVSIPHKLLGATSGFPGHPDLCQDNGRYHDTGPDSQHIGHVIHQQERRDELSFIDQTGQDDLVMVHEQRDTHSGGTYTGYSEHYCRRGVTPDERPVGMEIKSSNFQQNRPTDGTIPNRSVCIKSNSTGSPIFQLETGPSCRGDRCISPELEGTGLRQSSLVPDTTCTIGGENTEGNDCSDSTGLEDSGLVSNIPINPDRLPQAHTSRGINNPSGPPNTTPSQRTRSPTGRMAYLRESCEAGSLSEEASKLLMASWRNKSQSTYNSLFHKWERWCNQRNRSPIHGPVGDIANFLAELFQEGYSYSSLNSYRSAISSVHERIEGMSIGQHPTVVRILKGAFNIRPPQPRYTSTWRVSQVVQWLYSQKSSELSILDLSTKTATLCVLTRPCCSAELSQLNYSSLRITPEGTFISPLTPPKQTRAGSTIKEYFFPVFPDNLNICPMANIQEYCRQTQRLRPKHLFLTSKGPHKPATSATIARWIKTTLSRPGVDTSIFRAHSIRGASTSAAADAGISIPEILEAADWSNKSTFERFYYRPRVTSKFGVTVLNLASNLQS